jgi:hypothetical protein
LEKEATKLQNGIANKRPEEIAHIALDNSWRIFGRHWACNSCEFYERCLNTRREKGEMAKQGLERDREQKEIEAAN